MIKRILEIGVAVNDIKTSGSKLHDILNAQAGMIIKDDGYGMVAQMFRVGNIEFELMEPLHQDGMIAKFLETRGEGLHHIAFEVDDIIKSIKQYKEQNIRLINEKPISIYGCKAIFLHPELFSGVLIELIEGDPRWVANSSLPTKLQKQVKPQGVGAEGILEVGILVQELEVASVSYSKIFPSATELKPSSSTGEFYRAGNVDLKLIGMIDEKDGSYIRVVKNQTGLSHITLKVGSIDKVISYLKMKGIDFLDKQLAALYDSESIFIHPNKISGIPIFLKE